MTTRRYEWSDATAHTLEDVQSDATLMTYVLLIGILSPLHSLSWRNAVANLLSGGFGTS